MPSTSRATSAFAANTLFLLAMASWAGAADYTLVAKGCYSSSQPLKSIGTWTYQSSGYCQKQCEKQNAPVLGLSNGNMCWCGSLLPAADTKVSDSNCDTPCQGWPDENCGGGNDYWTIWLTGQDTSVGSFGGGSPPSSESSSASTPTSTTSSSTTAITRPHRTTHRPQVVTSVKPGTTVVITRPAAVQSSGAAQPTSQSSGGSTNVAGIAAGAVVGVVAAASIVTGIYFWLRHRRREAAENDYKKTQVSDFIRGGERKPPPTGYSSTSDSRLDPEAGNRRNSHGSIADNQDYSRRILRVANPDGGS